jgi:phosphoribosylamine--glycine ligase
MKILVVGAGGREHAIAWKIAQSEQVTHVFVAPGNAGTINSHESNSKISNVPLSDIQELAAFAQTEGIAYTVVGPEKPLSEGIVDVFRARNLSIFGPTQAAAQLESSKDFAKAFMQRHGIPTAEYQTFHDAPTAHVYINQKGAPIVVKADGLAAGKGVVVAMTLDEAHQAVDMMLSDNQLGAAGARVVIEEFLTGVEASFIVMVDGKNILPLATSQDHKRLLDHDLGPNTGGMGAYSPAPVVTPEIHAQVMDKIIRPTVEGMQKDGIPFTGFLYAGLMISPNQSVKTLEFNCRMGDPETQPIMTRLRSDFVDVLRHADQVSLNSVTLEWDSKIALGVVMAAHNYPGTPRTGDTITGIPPNDAQHVIFHAGTQLANGKLTTNGGRIICVVGLDETVEGAQTRAYEALAQIHFDGSQYRTDIGYQAIQSK